MGRIGEAQIELPCKLWIGAKTTGYGVIRVYRDGKAKNLLVHRWAWEKENGPIPEGMEVCHHCDVPACYEITHLFLGTRQDNMTDMKQKGRGRKRVSKTHCKYGHEMTIENTYSNPNGARDCIICRREASRRHQMKMRRRLL